ncbi:preprotein translocase subunit SecG [Pedobacter sp. ASV1-7]|uniref:preprotein translocase subunit SecG n=1 Tax=Pedobacter sp. ASV1-7 TaxID=3145237 RepID=UPI0032E91CF4
MLFLIILLIIVCVALGLFVLIQNPKGGGLATGGGAGSNMFGVQRTGDVLEKGTWVLLTLIVVLSLSITTIAKSGGSSGSAPSKIQEHLDKTVAPSPIGSKTAPTTAPATADTTKK